MEPSGFFIALMRYLLNSEKIKKITKTHMQGTQNSNLIALKPNAVFSPGTYKSITTTIFSTKYAKFKFQLSTIWLRFEYVIVLYANPFAI